jgi:hypothetical protein
MAPAEPALFEVEDHFELATREAVVLIGQVRRGVVAPGMWASRGGGDAGWAIHSVEIATRRATPGHAVGLVFRTHPGKEAMRRQFPAGSVLEARADADASD